MPGVREPGKTEAEMTSPGQDSKGFPQTMLMITNGLGEFSTIHVKLQTIDIARVIGLYAESPKIRGNSFLKVS
jgi:hypothetical protein